MTSAMAVELLIMQTARITLAKSPPGTTSRLFVGGAALQFHDQASLQNGATETTHCNFNGFTRLQNDLSQLSPLRECRGAAGSYEGETSSLWGSGAFCDGGIARCGECRGAPPSNLQAWTGVRTASVRGEGPNFPT